MIERVRILLGMDRPEWDTFAWGKVCKSAEGRGEYPHGTPILCTCGVPMTLIVPGHYEVNKELLREHWQKGHFDEPVYKYVDAEEK